MKFFQSTKLKTLSIALFALLAIGIGSVATGDSAFAATKTWTGATDNTFNTAGNWSPSGVPTTGDDIVIDNSTGSSMGVTNDIATLSLGSITLTGNEAIAIGSSSSTNVLTMTGPITSTTAGTTGSTVAGKIVLGADVVSTDVVLATGGTDTITLGGFELSYITTASFPQGTISIGQIVGSGTFTIDVRSAISIFLKSTNSYSGTTNLVSGVTSTLSGDSNTAFGSSSIIVGFAGSLALDTSGATWTFSNPITIQQAVLGESGYTSAQLYVWGAQADQVINIPNITLTGSSRFDLNQSGAAGSKVNLAGITTNGYCVQYGYNNSGVDEFINGAASCFVGNDIGTPNTAVQFVQANPFLIIILGAVTASFIAVVAIRSRSNK